MKTILVLLLVGFSVALGFSFASDRIYQEKQGDVNEAKKTILRFALVSDSENENDLLANALNQARGKGINFVIGLGDWSSVGTIRELMAAKEVFDDSKLEYFLLPGDHDLWDSRNKGLDAQDNFKEVFGKPSQTFTKNGIQFVLVDNSDIYKGISDGDWSTLRNLNTDNYNLTLIFSHKTPFHPQSSHIMGEDSQEVATEAEQYLKYLEAGSIGGIFSGDLHFFAQFQSPGNAVKITTSGAASATRNFQGPRYEIVTVYDDYSWDVADFAIR